MATHMEASAAETPQAAARRGPFGDISVRLAIGLSLLITSLIGTLVTYVISLLLT